MHLWHNYLNSIDSPKYKPIRPTFTLSRTIFFYQNFPSHTLVDQRTARTLPSRYMYIEFYVTLRMDLNVLSSFWRTPYRPILCNGVSLLNFHIDEIHTIVVKEHLISLLSIVSLRKISITCQSRLFLNWSITVLTHLLLHTFNLLSWLLILELDLIAGSWMHPTGYKAWIPPSARAAFITVIRCAHPYNVAIPQCLIIFKSYILKHFIFVLN